MEKREALDADLAKLEADIGALQATVASLRATISETETEIDDEIARETAARADLAKPIAETLLRDYERRRARNRGAGAARLVGTTCQACHLTIPSTEAEQIRRVGVKRVLYGSDAATAGNLRPREGWALFHSKIPLSDDEFRIIARNVPPYMR